MMFINRLKSHKLFLLILLSTISLNCESSISLNGTRYVYSSNEKEITVKVSNKGTYPVVIQSWIDKGEIAEEPEIINAPFILTPPVTRVEAGKSKTLRLKHTSTMNDIINRESVFWLNVLEIPPTSKNSDANKIKVAYRTRVKVFYRPEILNNPARLENAMKAVKWRLVDGKITAFNDSPYYVSMTSARVKLNGKESLCEGLMLEPFSNVAFPCVQKTKFEKNTPISWSYINDLGSVEMGKGTIDVSN